MMAYSSIAHAGFLIAAVLGAQYSGTSSLVYYAASFVFFNFMAFAGIQFLEQKAGSGDLEKFRGLGASNVLLGIAMLVSMIALAGLPPTSGFTAKLLVFTDLFWLYKIEDSPVLLWLFVLGLANIVVSLFYYLKIPYLMFFKKASGEEKAFVVDTWRILLWAILSVMTLLPFFWPKVFLW